MHYLAVCKTSSPFKCYRVQNNAAIKYSGGNNSRNDAITATPMPGRELQSAKKLASSSEGTPFPLLVKRPGLSVPAPVNRRRRRAKDHFCLQIASFASSIR